ncbi:hypothetical protein ILYODFUR_025729 [Ilyodon furcidens]|uniref:Uncharacterized protein n=1 Tax=Ilyodon furcidens TaxID=33524 RepID=A0ABV0TXP5_9TELE
MEVKKERKCLSLVVLFNLRFLLRSAHNKLVTRMANVPLSVLFLPSVEQPTISFNMWMKMFQNYLLAIHTDTHNVPALPGQGRTTCVLYSDTCTYYVRFSSDWTAGTFQPSNKYHSGEP